VMKELHAAGKLNAVQELWMSPRKPPVEFYDTQSDPFEVKNLASSPAHERLLSHFAKRLDDWMLASKDRGGIPEPQAELDQWIK